ncbi:MAG: sulfotransferase, partial [Planctomycetes bacterium]|nr:sulfotransferase [Planctomycetota bacterium]
MTSIRSRPNHSAPARDGLFYLLGFQRSGTTLLASWLDRHPDIVCVEEPELCKDLLYRRKELLLDTSQDSLRKMLDYYHIPDEIYLTLARRYLEGKLTQDRFLRQAYQLCNRKSATCVGAKEVCDVSAFKHGFLPSLFDYHQGTIPKFIFLERDIQGVVASFNKLGFYPPNKRLLTRKNLRRFASDYVKCINSL